jgi:hypothetical protein
MQDHAPSVLLDHGHVVGHQLGRLERVQRGGFEGDDHARGLCVYQEQKI